MGIVIKGLEVYIYGSRHYKNSIMQRFFKGFGVLILVLTNYSSIAQEAKIVQLLNTALKKEIKIQLKAENFNGDTISIVQPYAITADKRLTIIIKNREANADGYSISSISVALKDIVVLTKDINILFETKRDAVRIERTFYPTKGKATKSTYTSDLFFTQLYLSKGNEYFRDELLEAFGKAGYKVGNEFWADWVFKTLGHQFVF